MGEDDRVRVLVADTKLNHEIHRFYTRPLAALSATRTEPRCRRNRDPTFQEWRVIVFRPYLQPSPLGRFGKHGIKPKCDTLHGFYKLWSLHPCSGDNASCRFQESMDLQLPTSSLRTGSGGSRYVTSRALRITFWLRRGQLAIRHILATDNAAQLGKSEYTEPLSYSESDFGHPQVFRPATTDTSAIARIAIERLDRGVAQDPAARRLLCCEDVFAWRLE